MLPCAVVVAALMINLAAVGPASAWVTLTPPSVLVNSSVTPPLTLATLDTDGKDCKIEPTSYSLPEKSPPYTVTYTGSSLPYKTGGYIINITCQPWGKNDAWFQVHVEPPTTQTITFSKEPEFVTVPAKTATSTAIYTVIANAASGGSLTYKLSSQYAEYFDVSNTGVITVKKSLTGLSVTSLRLSIDVTETSSSGTTTYKDHGVMVFITDPNLAPDIQFNVAEVVMADTVTAGSIVATYSVKDSDGDSQFSTSCTVVPAAGSGVFSFDNGQIAVIQEGSFDSEYTVTCTTYDESGASDSATLHIYVTGSSEAPTFTQSLYSCTLLESKAHVSTCDPKIVTTPDRSQLTFELLAGNRSERFFYNQTAGRLMFNTNYDYENSSLPRTVYLQLQAKNAKQVASTVSLRVNIEDDNDNAPVCIEDLVTVNLSQADSVGTLTQIQAKDADSTSPNNEVTYWLLSTSSSAFSVSSSTGEITYNTKLQATEDQIYYLHVLAEDGGYPTLATTCTVAVWYRTTPTTTTTSTTTAATTTTTRATTTTTAYNFLDRPENVALLVMMILLLLAALAALAYALYRFFGQGGAGANCCRRTHYRRASPRVVRRVRPVRVIRREPVRVVREVVREEPKVIERKPIVSQPRSVRVVRVANVNQPARAPLGYGSRAFRPRLPMPRPFGSGGGLPLPY